MLRLLAASTVRRLEPHEPTHPVQADRLVPELRLKVTSSTSGSVGAPLAPAGRGHARAERDERRGCGKHEAGLGGTSQCVVT